MQVPSGLLAFVPRTVYRISLSVTPGTPEIDTLVLSALALAAPARAVAAAVVGVASSDFLALPHAANRRQSAASVAMVPFGSRDTEPPITIGCGRLVLD